MKPFPACYRARYRAANCHRGFPSFLNGGKGGLEKDFPTRGQTRASFIVDGPCRGRIIERERELPLPRSRAANCVRQSPTFLPLLFSFSASFPRGNARLQGLTRPGLGSAASLSNGTSTSWLQRPLECVYLRVVAYPPICPKLRSMRKLHPVSKPDSQMRKDLRIARESFCPSPFSIFDPVSRRFFRIESDISSNGIVWIFVFFVFFEF